MDGFICFENDVKTDTNTLSYSVVKRLLWSFTLPVNFVWFTNLVVNIVIWQLEYYDFVNVYGECQSFWKYIMLDPLTPAIHKKVMLTLPQLQVPTNI